MVSLLSSLPAYTPVFSKRVVLVDGLNLIRLWGRFKPRLTVLLSALVELYDHAYDVITVTDANTFHELREHNPAEAFAYRALLADFPEFFVQTHAGVPADPIILHEATLRDALIVSSDRYHQHARDFPWVKTTDRVLGVRQFRNHLHIGRHVCPLRDELTELMTEIRASLLWRTGLWPRTA